MPVDDNNLGTIYFMDSGGEYKPLDMARAIDITPNIMPEPTGENFSGIAKDLSLTIETQPITKGAQIFLNTGNALYLRCPKKLRRSRRWRNKL